MNNIEILGYVSMIVVLLSMIMKDMVTLRIVNTLGCALFVVYGIFIGSYPVQIMNALIIIINMYYVYYRK